MCSCKSVEACRTLHLVTEGLRREFEISRDAFEIRYSTRYDQSPVHFRTGLRAERLAQRWTVWRLSPDSDPQGRVIITTEDGEGEITGIVHSEANAQAIVDAHNATIPAPCGPRDALCERLNVDGGGDLTPAQRKAVIVEAREQYARHSNDDIEIDDEPALSRSAEDSGTWVAAWVWVSDLDLKDTDPKEAA